MRATLFLTCLPAIVSACWGASAVDVKITPTIRDYCHIVRFPQGWTIVPYIKNNDAIGSVTPIEYSYWSYYEFRVQGELGTRFLVRGFEKLLDRYYYTNNAYEVDLSDPNRAPRPATDREWESGAKIPDSREADRRVFALVRLTNSQSLPFHGLQFSKTGNIWPGDYARVSPGGSRIVLLSSSGSIALSADVPLSPIRGRDKGRLFFDVYNVDTGRKLITIVGTYVDINPQQAVNQALWVTERYFIVPLGDHRERCLVCEFGHPSGKEE